MWWTNNWAAPWMFFGPTMMLVLMVMFLAGTFLMIRVGQKHRASAKFGLAGAGLGRGPPSQHVNARPSDRRRAAFEKYRNETRRRVDQDETEFHDVMAHLRIVKDRIEFDHFVAERRNRPPAREVTSLSAAKQRQPRVVNSDQVRRSIPSEQTLLPGLGLLEKSQATTLSSIATAPGRMA